MSGGNIIALTKSNSKVSSSIIGVDTLSRRKIDRKRQNKTRERKKGEKREREKDRTKQTKD